MYALLFGEKNRLPLGWKSMTLEVLGSGGILCGQKRLQEKRGRDSTNEKVSLQSEFFRLDFMKSNGLNFKLLENISLVLLNSNIFSFEIVNTK